MELRVDREQRSSQFMVRLLLGSVGDPLFFIYVISRHRNRSEAHPIMLRLLLGRLERQ